MTTADQARLEEQRGDALRDLAEVDAQVDAGEIDPAVAVRLRAVYREEADRAELELERLRREEGEPARDPAGRSRTRLVAGGAVLVAAAAAVVVLAVNAVEPRPAGGTVTGGVAADVASGAGPDLAQVTDEELEAVVAANPGVVGMRLALARRYVEGGRFSEALAHYQVILDEAPHPEALAYVGWLSYLSDEPELAARYLERSLEMAPDFRLAQWFLANVRYTGLGDPAGARPLLEAVRDDPAVPTDVREAAADMLDAAP